MTGDEWIIIPNWDKFQHYKKRNPPWIKLYTGLGRKPEWLELTDAQRGLLVVIWIECARSRSERGRIKVSDLAYHGRNKGRTRILESLNHAGLIQIVASNMLETEVKEKRKEPFASKEEPQEPLNPGFDQASLELAHRWLQGHPVAL